MTHRGARDRANVASYGTSHRRKPGWHALGEHIGCGWSAGPLAQAGWELVSLLHHWLRHRLGPAGHPSYLLLRPRVGRTYP